MNQSLSATSTHGRFGVDWEPTLFDAFVKSQILLIECQLEKSQLYDRYLRSCGSIQNMVMCYRMLLILKPLVEKNPRLKIQYDRVSALYNEIMNPRRGDTSKRDDAHDTRDKQNPYVVNDN